jgi:AraC-like DNA-binding protein
LLSQSIWCQNEKFDKQIGYTFLKNSMLTVVSETYGLIVPGQPFPGGDFKMELMIRPGYQAELISLRILTDDRFIFSNLPWPYTLVYVFGYSVILSLSTSLKREMHDRGGHFFYTVTGSYKIQFQKDRDYMFYFIHYATDFIRENLEQAAESIRASWEQHSPVFYYTRPRIAERENMGMLAMLILPGPPYPKNDFISDEIARSILMDFLLEHTGSFQPSYIGISQFQAFYKERDELFGLALKSSPISKLVNLAGIKQVPLFRKRLRQLYNLNIREYLTEIRMVAALGLLKDPTFSVKEIAAMTGFSNPFYFSRVFTNYYGQPPKSFQSKNEL